MGRSSFLDNVVDGGFTEFLDSLVSGHQAQHQHRWRAWVVNTECPWQEGSHWFTVVAGSRVSVAGPFALLLQTSPIRRMTFLHSSHTILAIFCKRDFCRAGTTTALKRACAGWNAALVDGTHASRQRRRKLCKDHGIQAKPRRQQKCRSNSKLRPQCARSEGAETVATEFAGTILRSEGWRHLLPL